MKWWMFRYRAPVIGVQNRFLEASTLVKAIEVGKAYCEKEDFRFIGVEDPIVADESILPEIENLREAKAVVAAAEARRPVLK